MLPTEPSASDPQPTDPAPIGEIHPPIGLDVAPAPVLAPRSSASARGSILALAMVVISILAGGALFVSGFLVGQRAATQPGTPVAAEQDFQTFWDSYDTITSRYAGGAVDQKALINGAIKGMVDALGDPYSAYLTPDEYRQGLQDLSGQFEGIGAEIGTRNAKGETSDCTTLGSDCVLIVVTPIEGSPAE